VNLSRVSKAIAAAASAGAATFGTALASGLGYWPAIGAAVASGAGAFFITYRAPANA
jgi:hypothetical protein